MHFRIGWSLQLLFIEHHWNHRFFFCILTKFGHPLQGETFLGVDEVFFFQLVKEILLLELKNVLLIHVCANRLHAFAELFLDMTQRNIKGLRFR